LCIKCAITKAAAWYVAHVWQRAGVGLVVATRLVVDKVIGSVVKLTLKYQPAPQDAINSKV